MTRLPLAYRMIHSLQFSAASSSSSSEAPWSRFGATLSCQMPSVLLTQSPAFMSNIASCLSPIWLTAIGVRDSDFQSEASKLSAPNLPLDTTKRK